MSGADRFQLWMALLSGFLGGLFTFGGVFFAGKKAYRDWERQHQVELAEAAARRVVDHLSIAKNCLSGTFGALAKAKDEIKAAVSETGDLRPYEGLGEQVWKASDIVRDLEYKQAVAYESVDERDPESSQRIVSWVMEPFVYSASSDIDKIIDRVRAARLRGEFPDFRHPHVRIFRQLVDEINEKHDSLKGRQDRFDALTDEEKALASKIASSLKATTKSTHEENSEGVGTADQSDGLLVRIPGEIDHD